MNFFEMLRNCRKNKKLTQKQMAELLDMTERGYQNYEIGRSEPDCSKLVEIADILDVSVDYLLGRTDNPDSHKHNLSQSSSSNV